MSVDLPAPFSPTIAWISPARTVRSTLSSATTPGKVLRMARISRMAGPAGGGAAAGTSSRWRVSVMWAEAFALLDLRFLVVTAVDQDVVPVRLVHQHRLEQVRRHDLDAVVVRLGVVDLGLLAAQHRVDHAGRDLGELARVLEDRRGLFAREDGLDLG